MLVVSKARLSVEFKVELELILGLGEEAEHRGTRGVEVDSEYLYQ